MGDKVLKDIQSKENNEARSFEDRYNRNIFSLYSNDNGQKEYLD